MVFIAINNNEGVSNCVGLELLPLRAEKNFTPPAPTKQVLDTSYRFFFQNFRRAPAPFLYGSVPSVIRYCVFTVFIVYAFFAFAPGGQMLVAYVNLAQFIACLPHVSSAL